MQYNSVRHIRARSSAIGKELELALQWWLQVGSQSHVHNVLLLLHVFVQVLEMDIVEERKFCGSSGSTGHLFTDARSTPPRVAAVLFLYVASVCFCMWLFPLLYVYRDGKISHCDMEVPEQLMESFRARKDNQIMGLEILSIALGLCSLHMHCCALAHLYTYVQASAALPNKLPAAIL